MGLLLSVLLSYAGTLEAIDQVKHILSGLVPEGDPEFDDLVNYYTRVLQQAKNASTSEHWAKNSGQGYLCLNEDELGNLTSATIKYYGSDSTALLFSTKISSFGDSVDSGSEIGNKRTPERYQSKTNTVIPQTTESFTVGSRDRSPYEHVSDRRSLGDSFERRDEERRSESEGKLTWHYRPLSPAPTPDTPEIHLSYEQDDRNPDYSDDFLRSLDGVKFHPLQRNDPSGRRRSFKKRHSSSSTSSRDSSRASREEELRAFTSLEEAEFGGQPNLTTHSRSRSRSRENSKDAKPDPWSVEGSFDSTDELHLKPKLKELLKLGSFEEEKPEETQKEPEVTETELTEPEVTETEATEDEDLDDFWGNSDD